MTYIYVDYQNKARVIKKNRALAKLQRDAVICKQNENITVISDCASPYANKVLTE